jgi:xylulose-5-phosphate/fructose-6-phosphate phosphoketolase
MTISEPGDPPAALRKEPGFASRRAERIVDARRMLTINNGSSRLKVAHYRLWEDTTEPPKLRARTGKDRGGEPDVVLGCSGDIPILETMAAVHWLRENAPELKVRVVNVVDLMTSIPRGELARDGRDALRRALYGRQAGRLRLPRLPKGHPRDRPRPRGRGPLLRQGFNEQGTKTTPFDMVVLNGMSRYHLAAKALRRAGKTSGLRPGDRAPTLISECEAALARAKAYSREHFDDPPEIRDWTWTT